MNRLINIECTKSLCSPKCTNNQIQKRIWKKVKCKNAENKGRGLYAEEDIQKGDFVIEYVGEVLSNQQMEDRLDEYPDAEHFYFITLGPNMIIDASRKGNNARYINHSCNPNLATQKWIVGNELKIGLFALRDISSGQELSFDYHFETFFDDEESKECFCGSENCRGTITKKETSIPKVIKNNDAKIYAKVEKEMLKSLEELFNFEEEDEQDEKKPRIQKVNKTNKVFLLRNKKQVMKRKFLNYCNYESDIKRLKKETGFYPWEEKEAQDQSKILKDIGFDISDPLMFEVTSLRKSKLKAMYFLNENVNKNKKKEIRDNEKERKKKEREEKMKENQEKKAKRELEKKEKKELQMKKKEMEKEKKLKEEQDIIPNERITFKLENEESN